MVINELTSEGDTVDKLSQLSNFSFEWEDEIFNINFNKLALRSSSSLIITSDSIEMWIFVVVSNNESNNSYLPLHICVNENYLSNAYDNKKGQSKQSDNDILFGRLVDRSIRPFLNQYCFYDIQVDIFINKKSGNNYKNICAGILGTNLCFLSLGLIDHPVIPALLDNREKKLNGCLCFSQDNIITIEMNSDVISVETLLEIVEQKLILSRILSEKFQEYKKIGRKQEIEKIDTILLECQDKKNKIKQMASDIVQALLNENFDIFDYYRTKNANVFLHSFFVNFVESNKSSIGKNIEFFNLYEKFILEEVEKKLFCHNMIKNNKRADGRSFHERRLMHVEYNVVSETHGSAVFTRGQTQVLCTCHLIDNKNEKTTNDFKFEGNINVKYKFFPFAVNSTGKYMLTSRREVGHGFLINNAVERILDKQNFPYSIACRFYVLSSDGSSSMLSTIACGILMYQCNVPIRYKVAGVSIGYLYDEENNENRMLVDISEKEDFFCNMDFKVAGTEEGILAIQSDIKEYCISIDFLRSVLYTAHYNIQDIIKKYYIKVQESNPVPCSFTLYLSQHTDKETLKNVMRTINKKEKVRYNILDEMITLTSNNIENIFSAQESIYLALQMEPVIGQSYICKIASIKENNIIIYCCGSEGFLNVNTSTSEYTENTILKVKIINIENNINIYEIA